MFTCSLSKLASMKNIIKQILALLLTATCLYVSGQKISVSRVEEDRSTEEKFFGNQCKVRLKVSGDELRNYKYTKIFELTKAVDDLGFDLILENKEKSDFKEIKGSTSETDLVLKIASRKASAIKELQGTIVLFNPLESNGSIYKVKDFVGKTDVNLLPGNSSIQLKLQTQESIEKAEKAASQKKESTTSKSPAESLGEGFANIFGGMGTTNQNQVVINVSGDASLLADVKFEENNGDKISYASRYGSGKMIVYSFSQKPASDWRMVIYVVTDASLKKIPFHLVDIDLP